MTRGVVLLTAALAAASLGLFAQDNSRNSPNPPSAQSAQVRSRSTGSAGEQNTASTSTRAVPGAATPSAQDSAAVQAAAAPPATPAPSPAIEKSASTSHPGNEAPANGQLPQTSTILPLLGLIGLGSLVAGLFARR